MKTTSFLRIYATRLAFLLAIAALLLFIPASLTSSGGLRIFLTIVIVLCRFGGGILLFLGNHRGAEINYFLYDRRRAKKRTRDELSAESVRDDILFYLRPFIKEPLLLWQGIPKSLHLQLEGEPQFSAPIAYLMLLCLAECDEQTAFQMFSMADGRTITYVCHAITDAKDNEMADYVYHLKKRNDKDRICMFFQKNAQCFRTRALRYVEQHFEEFYFPRTRFFK